VMERGRQSPSLFYLEDKMANDEVRGLGDRLVEAEELLRETADKLDKLGFTNSKLRKRILTFLDGEGKQ
jgi:tetrahydromethanopterin S-methyltransferase subunit H